MSANDLTTGAMRMLGDLQRLRHACDEDPERVLELALSPGDPGLRGRAVIGARAGPGAPTGAAAVAAAERRALLDAGAAAVEQLADPDAPRTLTVERERGLDLMLRFMARPALFLHNDRFPPPAPPWDDILPAVSPQVLAHGRRVGRIETGGPAGTPYAGTGFLVADDVVMTNHHVVRKIAREDGRWVFEPGQPTVAFAPDPDAEDGATGTITEVIGVHDRLDMGLLRVRFDGPDVPVDGPAAIACGPPDTLDGRRIYAIGYPAKDPRQNAQIAELVFDDRYSVKRLQPGAVLSVAAGPVLAQRPWSTGTTDADVFHHDASTLGGNSGSCVIDLDTGSVIGLHFAGAPRLYNDAVALWKLVDDPLLRAAGVAFA
jgi:S1-C subfamily serine protease